MRGNINETQNSNCPFGVQHIQFGAAGAAANPVEPVEMALVVGVIDGDTIDVIMDGADYRVRYIGIDAPEYNEACGGDATQANVALVDGITVGMMRDVSNTDHFGRLLRYVFAGETFVNAALVADGWAEAIPYPPDTAFSGYFELLEAVAYDDGRGCHPSGVFSGAQAISPTPTLTAGVSVTATGAINLRSGPGTNYSVVGTLTAGQTMRAEAQNGDWLYLANGMWVAGWLVTTQGNVGALPTRVAPAAPSAAPVPDTAAPETQSVAPAQPAAPAFICNCSRTCPQMASCEEAYFQLQQCGCRQRDGDDDGVPCETICPGG